MYLIDTDVIVHMLRGKAAAVDAMVAHANDPKAISAISFGELIYGCGKSDRPADNIAEVYDLSSSFSVIPVSEAIMERYGMIKASLVKQGRRIEDFDLVIAATALHLDYTLVTGNLRHFERVPGLRIENWAGIRPK